MTTSAAAFPSTAGPSTAYPSTAGEPERIPSGRLGIWWFLASEVMTFGGLIGCFILYRFAHGGWEEESGHVNSYIAAFNTLVLVTSSWTIVRAHAAVECQDSREVARNLLFTVLLGSLFICMKAFEYSLEIEHGYLPSSGLFWSFYYGMTGLHGLHVIGGIVWNSALFAAAARGRLWPNLQQRVEYAGLYWHFVDVVWIFLFPLIYLT